MQIRKFRITQEESVLIKMMDKDEDVLLQHVNLISGIIRKKFSGVKIGITSNGPTRKKMIFQVDGSKVEFNIGENVVFSLENAPYEILRHRPLSNLTSIEEFVDKCLDDIQVLLSKEKGPEIKSYARKYLGQEKKVVKSKRAIFIYYDKTFIVVTPNLIMLALKSTSRTIQSFELGENADFNKIFRIFKMAQDRAQE